VRRWLPLIILAAAQFVMVLDSSVMNVSISQIVADLDTTVTGVQLAITAYTLVMAAFMLVGAKLGDIWGRDRAFGIGLAVYGLGSLTTALSPNLYVLLLGWSLVEGLGAVLVIPAIAALTAANYEGKTRAFAYGIIGGVAGAAIAVGPVIGGWVTTNWSWRFVFVGEVVVVLIVLIVRKAMQPAPIPEHPPRLDFVGAALSAAGLGLIVFGILRSSSWGWLQPLGAPTIAGNEITPLGFSLVPFLITGGVLLLWFFGLWEERRERLGQDRLLERALLRIESLRAGLTTLMSQQLVLMGTFFVLPVYLQVVLGLDAFETGKRLLPMSVTMLIAALSGPKLAVRLAPRLVVQIGLGAMVIAALVLVGTIDAKLNETPFKLALALFGVGAGLLMSQLGNVIMSSAPPGKTNEAGGLQGTAQNLGASLGTALIGSVLLAGLLTGFTNRIATNPAVPEPVRTRIEAATEQGIDIVTTQQARAAAISAGLTPAEADAVTADYADAELEALKKAMLAVALLALLSLLFTRRLPGKPSTEKLTDLGQVRDSDLPEHGLAEPA
jgi:EmrB/QacA subfamily drug resistance transporter